jgi:hypothetical protein
VRRLWGSTLPLPVVFTLLFAVSAATFAQSGGQTLYNGITLPEPWPPSQQPTQADPVPTYITNPPAVIPIDLGRQLFVDDFLIQQTTMVQTQHQVIMYPPNPIIVPGPSDYGYLMPYGGGEWFDPADQLYKLWLYCGGATLSGVCYEYSTDGKNWIRPTYPDVLVPGTDIVLNEGLSVWMDLQDIPARKFKAFEYVPNATYQVLYYYSADGIHWTSTTDTQYPIPLVYDKTSFFWNPFRNVWVDSMKDYLTLPAAPTRAAYLTRARAYSESPDLMNWTPGEPADPSDPNLLANSYWTGPDVDDPPYVPGGVPPQLYNLDGIAYESLIVGMFSWFYPGPAEDDPNDLPGPDIVEMGVGFSRDGFQWVRPTRGSGPGPNGAFIPASDVAGTWDMGNTQGAAGCFMVVGDELWFYFSGRSGPHADASVTGATGLATLRRDGFYSMDAGATPASLTTRPVQFKGSYMFVNVNDPTGSLTIQVLNPTTSAVLATSQPISVNKTLQAVSWTNGVADLTQWENQPVEFEFSMTNGELYSFWVTSSAAGASNGYVAGGGPGFTGITDTLGTAAYPTVAATPEISPAGAVFSSSVTVTIFTGTLNATIHYTLDGSMPTTSSPVYTGPFQLTRSAIVNAVAFAPGLTMSPVGSETFTLDNTPPTVVITAPTNGQTVSAGIPIWATALDAVGVSNVEFLVDGNPVGTATTSPYTITFETTTVTNASHQLTAIATDLAGNQGTSSPVTINVQNVSSGPTAGLVGYWSFDPAYVSGTTLFDQSGNNNNAAANFTIFVPGAVGQAVQFNGSSSYTQVGPASSLYDLTGNLSLSLWVQTTNSSANEALISKYASGSPSAGYLLDITPSGTAQLVLGSANVASGATVANDTTKINDGNWHHLAVMIALGSSVSFYVDGTLSSTEAIDSKAAASTASLEMGFSSSTTAGTYFTGSMDEVRIYSVALSAANVLSLAGPALVTPTAVSLSQNQQQQFFADVHAVTSQGVTWTISPSLGMISTSGLYTAPASVAAPQVVTVTATSTVNTSQSAVATVNLTTVSAVNFLGADTTTEGNWHGVYGLDGYSVADDSQSTPAYASFTIANEQLWTWESSTTNPVALENGSNTGRLAAAWWSATTFDFTVNVTDGKQHAVALYVLDFDNKARIETIQVVDIATGDVLDTRSISGFTNGIYLIWNISGSVQINVTSNAGPNGVVSGIFFGTATNHGGESVSVSPQTVTLSAGQTQQLTATVYGTTSQQVSWSILSVNPPTAPAGSFTSSSSGLYDAPQTGLVPAQVTVQAMSADGKASGTATISLTTGATASLVTLDTSTQGNWPKLYGGDGYSLAQSVQSVPAYSSLAVGGQLNWTWTSSTSDVRALDVPGGGEIAAAWYNTSSFTLNVNVGSSAHQFALYALDWDSKGRSEAIAIQDANTKVQLFSQTISNFSGGVYLVWNITGSVIVTVTNVSGPNAVVSGVFWGSAASSPPPPSPTLSIAKTHTGNFTQGQQGAAYTISVSNAANVSATSGTVTVTENIPSGFTLASMAGTGWTCSIATASCNRSDPLGAGSSYQAIAVTVNVAATASSPQVNQVSVSKGGSASANASDPTIINAVASGPDDNSATFLSTDTATQGNWMGVYGGDGYDIANGPQSPAGGTLSYGSYALLSQSTWTWAPSTADPRALQIDNQGDRTSATWYNATNFSFNVNFTDNNTHRVALYTLDWDSKGRSETIQVSDASSGATLSTQTVSSFTNGIYLIWNISGDVIITIKSTAGPNAVVAGIFFGGAGTITPPPVATAMWVRSDTATEGTWVGVYGSQGYSLATAGQSIQSFSVPATFSAVNQGNWVWASPTSDPRALETDREGDRAAATWYSASSFSLDLNLTDGQTHQVGVYVIDWDSKGRAETFSIADANSGKVLDTRSIPNATAGSASDTNTTSTNFVNGTYLIWNISGSVTITITSNAGPNAVASGIFVDP